MSEYFEINPPAPSPASSYQQAFLQQVFFYVLTQLQAMLVDRPLMWLGLCWILAAGGAIYFWWPQPHVAPPHRKRPECATHVH